MSQNTAARPIKLFLASPDDVKDERDALSGLVREVNDVLAFLAPERELRLELLRYETHTFPDYGQAQDVINRQIPADYDIFLGIMWKRCGTPTATSQSGTIEEFHRALARREQTGSPTIMFYFCDEPFPPPRGDDFEQYAKVMRFREELQSKGYTLSYPARGQFREYVRSGVLRAMADILTRGVRETEHRRDESSPLTTEDDKSEMAALAAQYDEVRQTMPSGGQRTARMSAIRNAMGLKSAAVRSMLAKYQMSTSAGLRLAAICILQQFPNAKELEWLAQRLDPEKEQPFVGYNAAVALAQAVRSLPASDHSILGKSLKKARQLAERNPHDPPRINVLDTASRELRTRITSRD
jgi:hypothetical protein